MSTKYPTSGGLSTVAQYGIDDFTTGSTIGPDGELYVTEGTAGEVLRIDRRSGAIEVFASGLPPKPFPDSTSGVPSTSRS